MERTDEEKVGTMLAMAMAINEGVEIPGLSDLTPQTDRLRNLRGELAEALNRN